MRVSYSSRSSFLVRRARCAGSARWSLTQSQISTSCSSPSFSCVSPSSSANLRNRMSSGSFACSHSPSNAPSFSSTRARSSLSSPTTRRSSPFSRFSWPPGSFLSASPFSRLRAWTLRATNAQTVMASLELVSWTTPLSSRSPCCMRARFSRHPCSSFRSAPLSCPFCSFFRTSRLGRLPLELRLPRAAGDALGSPCFASCLGSALKGSEAVRQGSEGGRQRLRTSSVRMEVKVVFLENGLLLAGLGLSSSGRGTVRSVASSSSQPMRLKWSLTSMRLRSSSVLREMRTLEGKTTAVSSMREMRRAMVFSSKGQKPQSISQSTTPSDQISAFMVQASPLSISGAMQIGEPSMVCERSRASLRGLQKPKSANLSTPLWRRMLLGLMSRCMMLKRMRMVNARRRSLRQLRARSSEKRPSALICCSRVPPLQYSQTKQQLLAVLRISMKRTTCVVSSIFDSVWISLMVNSSSLGLTLNFSTLMILMATTAPDFSLIALYTFPNSPSPICPSSTQFSIFFPIPLDYYNPLKPLPSSATQHHPSPPPCTPKRAIRPDRADGAHISHGNRSPPNIFSKLQTRCSSNWRSVLLKSTPYACFGGRRGCLLNQLKASSTNKIRSMPKSH